MPRRPARIARSSSRSSKKADAVAARTGGSADGSLLSVAHVTGAHGIRGALKVRPHGGGTTSLAAGREITLRRGGHVTVHTITRATAHGRGQLLVELDGLRERGAAETLAGSDVLVPTETLPAPGADEFYYHEMPGFLVETVDGRTIGEIADTMHTGTTDVWIVRTATREHMIPVVRDVVAHIDRVRRRVLITPIPGLLD
jgi:16S rRNA processing protein RimM